MKTLLLSLFQVIFWGWNLLFLLVVYGGILPWVLPMFLVATWEGLVPWDFSLTIVALIAIPTVCTALGIRKGFRTRPVQLMRLLYGVEAPLFVFCWLRLLLFRELNPATSHLLLCWGLAVVGFAAALLGGYAGRSPARATLQLIGAGIQALVGLQAGLLMLLYAVPLTSGAIGWLLSGKWWNGFVQIFTDLPLNSLLWVSLWGALLGLSAILAAAMPSALATLYLTSAREVWQKFAAQYGQIRAIAGFTAPVAATLVLFFGLQAQPQMQAFQQLTQPITSNSQRQSLIAESAPIKAGLLNAYLNSYRYLSSEQDSNLIQQLYEKHIQAPKPLAETLNRLHNQLISPFLYKGEAQDDVKAEQLYEQFFDTAIQKGEAPSIAHAIQSTWNRDEAKAGLLSLNQRKVWLRSQSVEVQENTNPLDSDWAEVKIHEIYENQTNEPQEVFYSFSLPESAVMTGVWLGDSGDLSKRFTYQVSPRGAAQQVYNNQVRVNQDPALLEQVGPRHYRLRVFPIPAKPNGLEREEARQNRPTEMHLWLNYRVMAQPTGEVRQADNPFSWPLPQLGERRNVYWTDQTQRQRQGKAVKATSAWLEPGIAAQTKVSPQKHAISLSTASGAATVIASPLDPKQVKLPQNQRYAVVLETSRSMGNHQVELDRSLTWLKDQGFANGNLRDNDADLYLVQAGAIQPAPGQKSPPRPGVPGAAADNPPAGGNSRTPTRPGAAATVSAPPVMQTTVTATRLDDLNQYHSNQTVFYGSLNLDQLLSQFQKLRGSTRYDGVIVLTDEGSYELSTDQKRPKPDLKAPLWLVHLGQLPPAYDDATVQLIQATRGGVGLSVQEVLQRSASSQVGPNQTKPINVLDGYLWQPGPTAPSQGAPQAAAAAPVAAPAAAPAQPQAKPQPQAQPQAKSGFTALAARQWIVQQTQQQDLDQLANLDQVHQIAKQHSIVSPYSSMIVLVNDEQRRQLKEAEAKTDRFEREVETGKETLTKPHNPLKAEATPEPATWVAVVVSGASLGALRRWQKRGLKRSLRR